MFVRRHVRRMKTTTIIYKLVIPRKIGVEIVEGGGKMALEVRAGVGQVKEQKDPFCDQVKVLKELTFFPHVRS